ncbi:hypothetical protein [Neosynechococcus sphagnicola]|uniref:hypothetical protein n=1 Tax=Neosynechococcus sphagnicola TaxID=1501145 RepID=UPI0030842E59
MSSLPPIALTAAIPVDAICYDERGLVPAIVQDYLDGTVLMMAWMNRDAIQKNPGNWPNLVLESIAPSTMAQGIDLRTSATGEDPALRL